MALAVLNRHKKHGPALIKRRARYSTQKSNLLTSRA